MREVTILGISVAWKACSHDLSFLPWRRLNLLQMLHALKWCPVLISKFPHYIEKSFSHKKKSLSANPVHTPFVCSIFQESVWYISSFCKSALCDVTQSACSSLSSHVTLQTSTMSYHAATPEEPNALVHNISSNIQRLTLLSKSHTALCHSHTYKCTQHANFHTTALTKCIGFVFTNTHLSPWVVIRCVFVVIFPSVEFLWNVFLK